MYYLVTGYNQYGKFTQEIKSINEALQVKAYLRRNSWAVKITKVFK